MPWGRLDDTLHSNGKVWSFSDKAFRVWMYSISYCNQKRIKDPEGLLSEAEARQMCQLAHAGRATVAELLEKGGWERRCDGYRIHDFEKYGIAVDATSARRMALFRNPELTRSIKQRDQDRCRYCGVYVRWNDRKSAGGGTFDHIDPAGYNEPENLVVACRGCNSRKGDRTPTEAGMPLLPVPRSVANLERAIDPIRSESTLPVPVPVPVPYPSHEASTQTEDLHTEQTARAGGPPRVRPAGRGVHGYADDFLSWWAVYPRHDAKLPASDSYQKRRDAGRPAEALLSAARHLAAYVDDRGIENEKIPHATTFLNQHRDEDWQDGPPDAARAVVANGRPKRESVDDQLERVLGRLQQ